MSFLTVLPLAFVMVAGPQILSAIFLATSEDWRRNSAAFVVGAGLSISLVTSLAYVFGVGARSQGASSDTVSVVVLVLLAAAMVRTYVNRAESKPPKWIGTLAEASPRFSFSLGFLLLGVFPTDILTSTAVGSHLANRGLPLTDAAGFMLLTLSFLALPSLTLLAFGERGQAILPKARDWMNANSWVVNEVVLAFFVVITITG